MAVVVLSGERFDGVAYGTAPGTGSGYVVGYLPHEGEPRLRVHDAERPALLYGVKYYHRKAGGKRTDDKPEDGRFAVTMLICPGRWRQRVWSVPLARSIEVLRTEPGDYIVWDPGLEHDWSAVQDSTMLTVKWKLVAPATDTT